MCGICGFVGKVESQGIVLESMMQALYHCEDGDLGEYYWENGAMASRQEEIVEIKGCYQPRVSEDGKFVLVCDGEISNAESLQKSLQDLGHVFRCGGDKEVILHAYEEYGEEIVNHLEGSYALVIWNCVEERLFAARDAKGGRPLYYALVGGRLAFATCLSSILAFVQFQGKAAMSSISSGQESLSGMETTQWKGIYQLQAGQDFRYEKNLLKLQCYCPPKISCSEEDTQPCQEEEPDLRKTQVPTEEDSSLGISTRMSAGGTGFWYHLLHKWRGWRNNQVI